MDVMTLPTQSALNSPSVPGLSASVEQSALSPALAPSPASTAGASSLSSSAPSSGDSKANSGDSKAKGSPTNAAAAPTAAITSALAPQNGWAKVLPQLAKDTAFEYKKLKCTAYSSKLPLMQITLGIYEDICNETFSNLKTQALKQIAKPASQRSSPFFIVYANTSIEAAAQTQLNLKKNKKKFTAFLLAAGINEKMFDACVESAKKKALAYFEEQHPPLLPGGQVGPMFTYARTKPEIELMFKKDKLKSLNFGYGSIGNKENADPITFTDQDHVFFGVNKTAKTADPLEMPCHAYALLQAREVQAKDLIFFHTNANKILSDFPHHLMQWGYEPVDAPQEGDLAVYFRNKAPVHVGYTLGNGLIRSKLGYQHHHSHEHQMFNVPPYYGTHVVFFRKKASPAPAKTH